MGFIKPCAGRIKITMTHGTEKMRETDVYILKETIYTETKQRDYNNGRPHCKQKCLTSDSP